LISVVVPVFRAEAFLDECILSLIRQDYKDLEIILVNDGSPDRSGDICDYYAKLDNRIRVIHKPQGGVSDARNTGISAATGEYIGFVDSDDFISSSMFSTLLSNLQEEDADISICGHKRTNEKGKPFLPFMKSKKKIRCFSSEKGIRDLLSLGGYESFLWNKLFRREHFEDVFFPVGRLYEDFSSVYKVFHKAKGIVYDSTALYFYRQQKGSIIHKMNSEKCEDFITASSEFSEFVQVHYPSLVKKAKFAFFRARLTTFFYRVMDFFSHLLAGPRFSQRFRILRKKLFAFSYVYNEDSSGKSPPESS